MAPDGPDFNRGDLDAEGIGAPSLRPDPLGNLREPPEAGPDPGGGATMQERPTRRILQEEERRPTNR